MANADKIMDVKDYSFHVVGIKNALKLMEEKLLIAETSPSLETNENVLKEILIVQMHNEMLELMTLRKIGQFKDKRD